MGRRKRYATELQQELVRLVRWRRTPEEQHHPHVLDVRQVPENDRHAAN